MMRPSLVAEVVIELQHMQQVIGRKRKVNKQKTSHVYAFRDDRDQVTAK